ncbi:efflux transporter outer membrane subunit [Rhodopseudomonas palustris]|uniref:RND efflux system, outer membrane lipoprotein, NodT n=1 Tax=Rhodopseudomonas palustris (strain BisB18) TaxID=316056 RepID=Q20XV5_RHOPB
MSRLNIRRFRHLSLLTVCALAACKTSDGRHPPEFRLPDRFTTGSVNPVPNPYQTWWRRVGNHELSQLIERGLANNLDIARAVDRINVASQRVTIAGADAFPQVGVGATTQSFGTIPAGVTGTTSTHSAGLNVSWLLDFNGKIAKQKSASEAELRAAGYDFANVRLAYLADLIATYIDMNYFARTIAVTEGSIKNAEDTVTLVRNMKELGTSSELDIAQAQADLATLRASLPALQRDRTIAANHIATLIGVAAGSLTLQGSRSLEPLLSADVGAGIPADLIRNRPDIRVKEQLLYAAAERIGVARADLLPSVTLNGTINAALSPTIYGMLGGGTWAFASSILAPVFDGERRQATIRLAQADCHLRYLDWRQNVLVAVEEVENLLTSIKRGQRELASLRDSVAANEKSLSLTRAAMTGGTGILLGVIDAQRSLNRSRLALAQSQRQLARFQISLQIAIGAGADAPVSAPVPVVAATTPAAPAANVAQRDGSPAPQPTTVKKPPRPAA